MSWLVTFGETMGLCTSRAHGRIRLGSELELSFGGAESNVAIGLSRLGVSAAWSGRVGNDQIGRMVINGLRGEGVDVSGVTVDDERPTGLMVKSSLWHGNTSVTYYRRGSAASALRPRFIRPETLAGACVLHVTGITPALGDGPRAAVLTAMADARNAGLQVCVDLNYRSRLWSKEQAVPVLRELLGLADIALVGQHELRLLGGSRQPEELVRELVGLGPRQVIAKLGAAGAVACVDGEVYTVPGRPVTVVDPVGAGDGFAAGFLSGVHDGMDPLDCVERGLAVAAVVVASNGDWEGLPYREDLAHAGRHTPMVDR